jgi:hypothetical protein
VHDGAVPRRIGVLEVEVGDDRPAAAFDPDLLRGDAHPGVPLADELVVRREPDRRGVETGGLTP